MPTTLEQPSSTSETRNEDKEAIKAILREIDELSPEDRQTVLDWLRETSPKPEAGFTIGDEPAPVAERPRNSFVDPGYEAAMGGDWTNTSQEK